jgi:hypothetical protein
MTPADDSLASRLDLELVVENLLAVRNELHDGSLYRTVHGGEGGIRTHVTISREHAFQACSFSHSDTSPCHDL